MEIGDMVKENLKGEYNIMSLLAHSNTEDKTSILTKRERLANKIIRLQEILNQLRKQWKQMPVLDGENNGENQTQWQR